MSINFGGYRFSEPVKLVKWKPPHSSGIYALLIAGASTLTRFGYQVIYFGEAESLAALSVDEHHPAYPCWLVIAGSVQDLYVSAFPTRGLTAAGRKALMSELVAAARPFCNYETRHSPHQRPPQNPQRG